MVGCRSERICQFPDSYSYVLLLTLIPIYQLYYLLLLFFFTYSYFLAVIMSNSPVAPHVSAVLAGKEKLSSVSVCMLWEAAFQGRTRVSRC